MQLQTGAVQFGNVMNRALLNVAAAIMMLLLKRAHCISEMSQNYSSYMQGKVWIDKVAMAPVSLQSPEKKKKKIQTEGLT
jgi:hypothetical protein